MEASVAQGPSPGATHTPLEYTHDICVYCTSQSNIFKLKWREPSCCQIVKPYFATGSEYGGDLNCYKLCLAETHLLKQTNKKSRLK